MTSSVEAYKKLKEYEDAEERGQILPERCSWRYGTHSGYLQILIDGSFIGELDLLDASSKDNA